jgi:fucose 4-O-acetylase-like acetyltransferase
MIGNDSGVSVQKQRLKWLDYAKVVGIFAVVVGHCADRHPLVAMKPVQALIYSWHMPFFFIMSGITFNVRKYPRFKDFLVARIKSLVVPYICLTLLTLPFGLLDNDFSLATLPGLLLGTISAWDKGTIFGIQAYLILGSYWFLPALFTSELCFYLLYRLSRSNMAILTALSFLAAALSLLYFHLGLPVLAWHVELAPLGAFYIFIGLVISRCFKANQRRIAQLGGRCRALAIFAAVVVIFLCVTLASTADLKTDLNADLISLPLIGLACEFLIAVGIFAICMMLVDPTKPENALMGFIARNCLTLFSIQLVPHNFLVLFFPGLLDNPLGSVFFGGILIFFLCLPLCYVLRRFLPISFGAIALQKHRALTVTCYCVILLAILFIQTCA